jgi:MFS family permease
LWLGVKKNILIYISKIQKDSTTIFFIGVINDYLEEHIFPDANSQFLLSWTATILEIFANMMGPAVQILLSNYGAKVVLIIGTLLVTLGLELASLSTEIWHLYLTFGVLFGIGSSFLYVVSEIYYFIFSLY